MFPFQLWTTEISNIRSNKKNYFTFYLSEGGDGAAVPLQGVGGWGAVSRSIVGITMRWRRKHGDRGSDGRGDKVGGKIGRKNGQEVKLSERKTKYGGT